MSAKPSMPSLGVGSTRGRLTVLGQADITGRRAWLCRCSCGTMKVIRQDYLVSGRTRSCGCAVKEAHSREIGVALTISARRPML